MSNQKSEYEKFQIRIGAQPVTLEDMKDPSIKKSIVNSLEYRVKKRISNLSIKKIFPPEIEEMIDNYIAEEKKKE